MSQKSDEFTRFENLVDRLLTVPKSTLKEKMDAHRKRVAGMPAHKRRGPKPGTKRKRR